MHDRMDKVSEALKATKTSILSVGSGDGSQQASIVRSGHKNIVVTFYDSRENVLKKYPSAAENLRYLDENCIEQHFSADARSIGVGPGPLGSNLQKLFDVIMFYFPHVGGDISNESILNQNQELIHGFLICSLHKLAPGGEIHLAVMTKPSYERLDVINLFRKVDNLKIQQEFPVDKSQFPGWVHRLTNGSHGRMASVNDSGSKVYVLSAKETPTSIAPGDNSTTSKSIENELRRLGARIFVAVPNAPTVMKDCEIDDIFYTLLKERKCKPQPTVLDLRESMRLILDPAILPDTRTCNRVLTKMKSEGRIYQGPPLSNGRKSKKPTWHIPNRTYLTKPVRPVMAMSLIITEIIVEMQEMTTKTRSLPQLRLV
mmetsp:Transcript_23608/g.33875  ORF Transcript_23608/g.33875 Transcript_23608/m.33875 type:complete len:372 (+) Transcript_23608:483-1598(+)